MKKRVLFIVAAVIVFSMIFMTACSKSELTGDTTSEKAMTITADNAAVDDYFMTGSLVVGENERIAATSGLEEGTIRIELIAAPGEQSADEVPDVDGDAILTYHVSVGDEQSAYMDPGSYMVKVTVEEKATGTIQLEVLPRE